MLYLFFIYSQWEKQSWIEIPPELQWLKYNIICCWDHRKLQWVKFCASRNSSSFSMCWVFPSCVWAKQAVLSELLQLDNQIMFTYGDVHVSAKSSKKRSGKMWSTASRKTERGGWVGASQANLGTNADCETASLFLETLTTN